MYFFTQAILSHGLEWRRQDHHAAHDASHEATVSDATNAVAAYPQRGWQEDQNFALPAQGSTTTDGTEGDARYPQPHPAEPTSASAAARARSRRVGGRARSLIHYGVPVDYPLVLALPQSDDQIVLTDYMDATPDHGNLARIRHDGTEVWRVTPATQSQDAWTVARLDGDVCRGSTWSGWDVTLDLATGRERSRVFTK